MRLLPQVSHDITSRPTTSINSVRGFSPKVPSTADSSKFSWPNGTDGSRYQLAGASRMWLSLARQQLHITMNLFHILRCIIGLAYVKVNASSIMSYYTSFCRHVLVMMEIMPVLESRSSMNIGERTLSRHVRLFSTPIRSR